MTSEAEKLKAVHHVVHEYANLVSSGEIVAQPHDDGRLQAPLNTHVQHAFLLNCRKMADFFRETPTGRRPPAKRKHPCKASMRAQDDVHAADFLAGNKVAFDLPLWEQWRTPINKQLAHITYNRVSRPKAWTGNANKGLLDEFRAAWREFLRNLAEPYRAKFKERINSKKKEDGFGGLDLSLDSI